MPIAARADFSDKVPLLSISNGAVKLMRTRIRLLAQPKSMLSIVGATVMMSGSLTYLMGCSVASQNSYQVCKPYGLKTTLSLNYHWATSH